MNNLSLNPDKIQFKSTDSKFFGHRLTKEGLKPDPEKIKAILAMQPLQSIQQLQSFNGMVNYLKRFSPVSSELPEPLRSYKRVTQSGHESQSNRLHLKRLRLC